jgi:hypothetical protein
MGFGVPVVKQKGLAYLAGSAAISQEDEDRATIVFQINRVLQFESPISRANLALTRISALFDRAYRRSAVVRGYNSLRLGKILRNALGIRRVFQEVAGMGDVSVTYRLKDWSLAVEADFSKLTERCDELCLLNEQGANHFSRYSDTSGLELTEKDVGAWEEVSAQRAFVFCDRLEVGFGLERSDGAALYRGRELLSDDLNWAGLNYQFQPREAFAYRIEMTGAGCDRCRIALPLLQTEV